MKNPLNQEQLNKLQEISRLDPENQKIALPDFLKTLTPEQISFLQQQQGGECVLCLIAEKKLHSRVLYEDEFVLSVLEIHPATKGHALVFPKQHFSVLAQVPDQLVAHLFTISHKLSTVLFDTLQAEGTNIHVANGAAAGQVLPHVVVQVIPRYDKDRVAFHWEPQKVTDKDLDALYQQLQGKLVLEKKRQEETIKPVELPSSADEEYYLP